MYWYLNASWEHATAISGTMNNKGEKHKQFHDSRYGYGRARTPGGVRRRDSRVSPLRSLLPRIWKVYTLRPGRPGSLGGVRSQRCMGGIYKRLLNKRVHVRSSVQPRRRGTRYPHGASTGASAPTATSGSSRTAGRGCAGRPHRARSRQRMRLLRRASTPPAQPLARPPCGSGRAWRSPPSTVPSAAARPAPSKARGACERASRRAAVAEGVAAAVAARSPARLKAPSCWRASRGSRARGCHGSPRARGKPRRSRARTPSPAASARS